MKLLVGLGNPGVKYDKTRHNAGFIVLDEIASRGGISWESPRFQAEFASGLVCGEKCVLLKPQTYMNLSGRSVGEAARFYKLSASDVVVLHDDVDVPMGKVKARTSGGAGGHNGIKDIITTLGTPDFYRIKLGVGRPEGGIPTHSWVLARMSDEQLSELVQGMTDEALLRLENAFQT